eukprot:c47842_g1_i1 orf=85-558(+)
MAISKAMRGFLSKLCPPAQAYLGAEHIQAMQDRCKWTTGVGQATTSMESTAASSYCLPCGTPSPPHASHTHKLPIQRQSMYIYVYIHILQPILSQAISPQLSSTLILPRSLSILTPTTTPWSAVSLTMTPLINLVRLRVTLLSVVSNSNILYYNIHF